MTRLTAPMVPRDQVASLGDQARLTAHSFRVAAILIIGAYGADNLTPVTARAVLQVFEVHRVQRWARCDLVFITS
jgi:hypothetical protein